MEVISDYEGRGWWGEKPDYPEKIYKPHITVILIYPSLGMVIIQAKQSLRPIR